MPHVYSNREPRGRRTQSSPFLLSGNPTLSEWASRLLDRDRCDGPLVGNGVEGAEIAGSPADRCRGNMSKHKKCVSSDNALRAFYEFCGLGPQIIKCRDR